MLVKLFTWYLQYKGYLVVKPCTCGQCDCNDMFDGWTQDEIDEYMDGYNDAINGRQLH